MEDEREHAEAADFWSAMEMEAELRGIDLDDDEAAAKLEAELDEIKAEHDAWRRG